MSRLSAIFFVDQALPVIDCVRGVAPIRFFVASRRCQETSVGIYRDVETPAAMCRVQSRI